MSHDPPPVPSPEHQQSPPRPEEEIADAADDDGADDLAADDAGPGASGPGQPPPGRFGAYPPSPRPADGPITSPTPEIADPGYRPPDYPTSPSDGDQGPS